MCGAMLSTDYINGKPPTTVYFIFTSITFRWKVLSRQLRLNLLHGPLVFLQGCFFFFFSFFPPEEKFVFSIYCVVYLELHIFLN